MSDHEKNQQKTGATVEVLGAPASSALKPQVADTLLTTKKDPEEFRKQFKKTGKIKIAPFIDGTKKNMGLENYGMAIFPGTHHEEQVACLERHGVLRYITGLDEYAPEVQNIVDKDQKAAVIYNIRSIVVHLEKLLATNPIEIDSKTFWNEVKLLRPDNHEFWGKITIKCSNEPVFLEPDKDPYDLVKFVAIEAGGFDLVAKSHEDALARPVAPKFFLDKEIQTVSVKTTYKRLRNKAIGVLDKLNAKKLLYVTKAIDTNSATYKNSTPVDILYEVLDSYIAGEGVETNRKRAAQTFMDVAAQGMEDLKLRALVKDASFYRIISLKPDGMLYYTQTSTMLGRNVIDVVLYLKNPLNEQILTTLMAEVGQYWDE